MLQASLAMIQKMMSQLQMKHFSSLLDRTTFNPTSPFIHYMIWPLFLMSPCLICFPCFCLCRPRLGLLLPGSVHLFGLLWDPPQHPWHKQGQVSEAFSLGGPRIAGERPEPAAQPPEFRVHVLPCSEGCVWMLSSWGHSFCTQIGYTSN